MTDTKQNTRISQFRFGQPKESLKLEHVALGALDKDKVRVHIEATNINLVICCRFMVWANTNIATSRRECRDLKR